MIHFFYLSLLLSELVFDPLDKLPLVVLGAYGLIRFVFRRGLGISAVETSYFVFTTYLLVSSAFVENSRGAAIYAAYFFLQFGLLSFILAEIRRNPLYFQRMMWNVVAWQSIVVVIGILDFLLFLNGIDSPIRDHVRSWKTDSFFQSPNILGVVSAVVVVYLLNWRVQKNRLLLRWLILLNLIGILLSGSSMALGVVLISETVRRAGFKWSFVIGAAVIGLAYEVLLNSAPDLMNRRLEIWTAALNAWSASPWFGLGTGNFQKFVSVTIQGVEVFGQYGLHSLYLWLLIETGVFGITIFGLFLISLFMAMRRSAWRDCLYALPLVFFLAQLTENYLVHEEVFIAVFWLMVASVVMMRRGKCNEGP